MSENASHNSTYLLTQMLRNQILALAGNNEGLENVTTEIQKQTQNE